MARWLTMSAVLAVAFAAGTANGEEDTANVVLDTSGFWRIHYTHKAPVVKTAGGLKKGEQKKARWINRDTEPPASGWQSPDFDDSGWRRLPGSPFPVRGPSWLKLKDINFGFSANDDGSPYVAHLAMRGKFNVADPAKVKGLTVSVGYRGGVVVYMNGKEVTRGHFAKGTDDTADALAEDYPSDAFIKPDGAHLTTKDFKTFRANVEKHNRSIADVRIPSSMLRRGVNVLAISVHRSAYHEDVLKNAYIKTGFTLHWSTCGLLSARLKAADPSGLEANCVRPKGLQVWNSDPMSVDFDLDWGDRAESLRPITLAGTVGGSFSGKVVVGSSEPIKGLKASATALSGRAGSIPASNVNVRYGIADRSENNATNRYPAGPRAFDGLDDVAPAEVAIESRRIGARGNWVLPGQPRYVFGSVIPVWVTVDVPRNTKAGDYKGRLSITAGGKKTDVPIEIRVAGFRLPEPKDFVTFVDLVQSPETPAMKYKVDFWSDRHFELIGESLALLGQIGNRTAYIPLICRTNQGNDQTMVRWTPKGDGYELDFSIMEKYLDLVIKKQGKPSVVVIYAWDYHCNKRSPSVSGKNGAEAITLPKLVDPKSKALWKPVMDGVKARLKARGLDKAMMLGLASDTVPTPEILRLFTELAPGTPWVGHSHGGSIRALSKSVPIGYRADVWGPRFGQDPADERQYGWKEPELKVHFTRDFRDYYPMSSFRFLAEMDIMGSSRGFGRQGADFWPVLADKKGRIKGTLGVRYNSWRNLDIKCSVLSPGAKGPVSSHRFEMMRESVQECEARIFIEKALLGKKISGDLARRCQDILDERSRAILRGANALIISGAWTRYPTSDHGWWYTPGQVGYQWYVGSGWQKRSNKLFDAASEVAAKVGY